MAVQRFLTDVDRTRRGAGAIFMAVAVGLAGWIASIEIRAGRVNGTGLVAYALLGGLGYLGWRLFQPKNFFEIDVQQRTYSVFRNGTKSGSGPLDALGPLEVTQRHVSTGNEYDRKTSIVYVVRAAAHSKLDLYSTRTAGQARRKMESLARARHVSCRSLGGAVRGPDDLDVPLHQRLRDDPEARKAADLRPEWGLRIEPLSLGYAMHSTLRSWASLRTSGFILAAAAFALLRSPVSGVQSILSSLREEGDLVMPVLAGLMGVVVLVLLWIAARGVRDTFFPGTVRVTDRGVSYRGSRIAFREIEEVTATFPIELIGDRRSLTLGETFCSPGAAKAVAHEIQRLIIEVAEANPHARLS
jgi:hypothetical protein